MESIASKLKNYLHDRDEERQQREQELSELMLTTDYHRENVANYNTASVNYMVFLQPQYMNLCRLKHYLENLLHVGHELGLYGLFLATEAFRKVVKSSQALTLITEPQDRELFEDAVERIDCLVDDILRPLVDIYRDDMEVMYSEKTRILFDRLTNDMEQNNLGRAIVFVQRVQTAGILSCVLSKLAEAKTNLLKIRYVTGSKASLGEAKMSAKYLVCRHFILDCDQRLLLATSDPRVSHG